MATLKRDRASQIRSKQRRGHRNIKKKRYDEIENARRANEHMWLAMGSKMGLHASRCLVSSVVGFFPQMSNALPCVLETPDKCSLEQ